MKSQRPTHMFRQQIKSRFFRRRVPLAGLMMTIAVAIILIYGASPSTQVAAQIYLSPTPTPTITPSPTPTPYPTPILPPPTPITISDTGVWVTTQDFSSLRAGPSLYFERLIIVPPEITMPAIGRTADNGWIQVVYEDQVGWIVDWLLVWSGEIISLPIDGVDPEPYARRTGILATTTRYTPLYIDQIDPSNVVAELPPGTQVELTGRLGSRQNGYFQLQVIYDGRLYWVGSWNLRFTGTAYLQLLDISYLLPYGRLVSQLNRDIDDSLSRLSTIEDIWTRLSSGASVSCSNIPEFIDRRRIADADLRAEPIFAPLVTALDDAIASTNEAISLFTDACSRAAAGEFLTQDEVLAAQDAIESARRNYVLADAFLQSLTLRNPLFDDSDN